MVFRFHPAVWTRKRSVKTHTTVMKRHNWRSEKDIIDGHSESVVSYPVFIFFRGPVPGPLRFIALGFRKRVMQMLLALFLWPYGRLSLTGNSVFTWPGIVSLMAVSDSCLQRALFGSNNSVKQRFFFKYYTIHRQGSPCCSQVSMVSEWFSPGLDCTDIITVPC